VGETVWTGQRGRRAGAAGGTGKHSNRMTSVYKLPPIINASDDIVRVRRGPFGPWEKVFEGRTTNPIRSIADID
jgi:hypothetical protein